MFVDILLLFCFVAKGIVSIFAVLFMVSMQSM